MIFLGFKDVQHFLCLVVQTKNFSVLVHLNNSKSTKQPTAFSRMNASERRAVSCTKKKHPRPGTWNFRAFIGLVAMFLSEC